MTEMIQLITMLLKAQIPFELTKDAEGNINNQIWYPSKDECVCDVISHKYSYGGKDGLLEIMGLLTEEEKRYDDVVGFLTAGEVFIRIWADYYGYNIKKIKGVM